METPASPGCRRCGHPWSIWTDGCGECPTALDGLRFAAPYEEPTPRIVAALKDRRRPALARDLAALICERAIPPGEGVALVPVPLTVARLRERGFNQALLLARELGRSWNRPVAPALVRTRGDTPQRGSSATERELNVRGAFASAGTVPVAACLIDDVCTTGATLTACARTLRRAGARWVEAVCVARVLR